MIEYQWYERLQEQVYDLKSTHRPIVIFGTMSCALIAKRVLDYMTINAVCFCDNDQRKQGTTVQGLVVLSPEQVKIQYPNAKIYICSYNEENIIKIKEGLSEFEFDDIHSPDIFLYLYNNNLLNRGISAKEYADIMGKSIDDGSLVIKKVAAFVTEKCTLRCKNCNILIPYYKNPKHYDKDFVIKCIKNLAQSVDVIENLAISGGEPFIYPYLVEICREASKIKNIKYISIITNGTVVPSTETLNLIKDTVNYISISNYGEYSPKVNLVIEKLIKSQIPYEVFEENTQWFQMGIAKQKSQEKESMIQIFEKCELVKGGCTFIINGQYHLCQVSAAEAPFNILNGNENNYVKLDDESLTLEARRTEVNKLLNMTKYLNICQFCILKDKIPVVRAEQTNETLML